MSSQYRRFSVNTSLRDAKIFFDDSSSTDDTAAAIKEEPVDDDYRSEQFQSYYNDNAVSLSIGIKEESLSLTSIVKDQFSSLSSESPIKQERIDFEKKLNFETDESTNGDVCSTTPVSSNDSRQSAKGEIPTTVHPCPPPPSISVKRNLLNFESDEKTNRDPHPPAPVISNDPKWTVKEEIERTFQHCPPPPTISGKRNQLKRRNEAYQRNTSECESENGVSPLKKPHFERMPKKDDEKKIRKQPESDPEVLRRRQKQIDYGKNTIGYEMYLQQVPRNKRGPRDPQTPDKFRKYSRRGWDGLIKQWRLKLHRYDPDDDEGDVKIEKVKHEEEEEEDEEQDLD